MSRTRLTFRVRRERVVVIVIILFNIFRSVGSRLILTAGGAPTPVDVHSRCCVLPSSRSGRIAPRVSGGKLVACSARDPYVGAS